MKKDDISYNLEVHPNFCLNGNELAEMAKNLQQKKRYKNYLPLTTEYLITRILNDTLE